jgi:ribosomal protein S18 acetylase RimI-like enzyme
VVEVAYDTVVSIREIPYRPVRTSQIRALEHAATMAWPGIEQRWLGGWFVRAGHGITGRSNSAVPLEFSANLDTLPAIIDWYRGHDLTALLLLPERVLPVRAAGVKATRMLVGDVVGGATDGVQLAPTPDREWRRLYEREVPVDVLTAVVGGALVFAEIAGAAVGRGAVTTASDGTRWLGISAVRVDPAFRRMGHARRVCAALLEWGHAQGVQRAYVEVLDDNEPARRLYESMGFRLHHTHRYIEAQTLLPPTI